MYSNPANIVGINSSREALNWKLRISINICGNSIVIQKPEPTLNACFTKHINHGKYSRTCNTSTIINLVIMLLSNSSLLRITYIINPKFKSPAHAKA